MFLRLPAKGPYTSWSCSKLRLDGFTRDYAEADAGHEVEISGWRVHDLRQTAATTLERLGVPPPVTEALLNHTSGSKNGVAGIYQQWSYGPEKREAVEKLGRHIGALVRRSGLKLAA